MTSWALLLLASVLLAAPGKDVSHAHPGTFFIAEGRDSLESGFDGPPDLNSWGKQERTTSERR